MNADPKPFFPPLPTRLIPILTFHEPVDKWVQERTQISLVPDQWVRIAWSICETEMRTDEQLQGEDDVLMVPHRNPYAFVHWVWTPVIYHQAVLATGQYQFALMDSGFAPDHVSARAAMMTSVRLLAPACCEATP